MEGSPDCLNLIPKEGNPQSVEKRFCCLSEFLQGHITDFPNEPNLTLENIDAKTLESIVTYLTKAEGICPKEIEKPLGSKSLKELIENNWEYDYIEKINIDDVILLTVAANFLGIQSLLDLCCARIASMCKDKNEEEIFKVFNITETFTEDEKTDIRKENHWIEENI